MAVKLEVVKICEYPVKSAAAVDLKSAKMGARGFEHDRMWVVADVDGKMITQRQEPRMALIRPGLLSDYLTLEADGMKQIKIPLEQRVGEAQEIDIHGRPCLAIRESEEACNWISRFLDRPASLLRFNQDFESKADDRWVGESGAHTGFADMLPYHICTTESLELLNDERARLGLTKTAMENFRPNLVISGDAGGAELDWPAIESQVGLARFDIVRLTSRCKIVETDQKTGLYNPKFGNNAALASMGNRFIDRDGRPGAVFGVQAILGAGEGAEIKVNETMWLTALSDKIPLPRYTKRPK